MSRGGRGGGRGGRGGGLGGKMMGGHPLPFNIDPEIEKEVERSIAEDSGDSDKELFPDIGLLAPRPVTDDERELVRLFRARRAKMKASPFWTGDPGDYAARSGDPNMPDGFNPFENAPTHSNSKRKRNAVIPNLKVVKNIYPQFFPKDFHYLLKPDNADGHEAKRPKKLALAKQSISDRLARFDDDAEFDVDGDEDKDDESAKTNKDDDADEDDTFAKPVDDTFEADEEDDDANDYNAEAYFDDGEADVDDHGDDDYGGDDGY